MRQVLMEAHLPGGWGRVGSVAEVEPPGSLSCDGPLGRRVLVFGWRDDQPGVWKSRGGMDIETEAFREIFTTGLERLSDLSEPYYIEISRKGLRMSLRFTVLG